MKKTICLAVLLLTAVGAFAQPAAAKEFAGKKEVVMVRHHNQNRNRNRGHRRVVRTRNNRVRR